MPVKEENIQINAVVSRLTIAKIDAAAAVAGSSRGGYIAGVLDKHAETLPSPKRKPPPPA